MICFLPRSAVYRRFCFPYLSLWPLLYHVQWTHYQKEVDEMGQASDLSSQVLPCKQGYFYWLILKLHPPIVFTGWNSENDTGLSEGEHRGWTFRRQLIKPKLALPFVLLNHMLETPSISNFRILAAPNCPSNLPSGKLGKHFFLLWTH